MSEHFLARLPLAQQEVDRDYLSRDSDALLTDPATRFVVLRDGKALLASPSSLALLTSVEDARLLVYLGRSLATDAPEPAGTPVYAAVVDTWEGPGEWGNLRAIGAKLSRRDAGLLAEALAITNWHASHAFSPLSGAPTEVAKQGWVLTDSASGRELFPRTDMAIIVGVVGDADRLLLGRNALWEGNRYSLLAGFVEPGESLEAAVVREVFEESGVRVTEPRYLGSQPWPFPASLMIGFLARAVAVELVPDGVEILELRWFSRDELRAALGEILLPGPSSIARAIIEEWYGGPLE